MAEEVVAAVGAGSEGAGAAAGAAAGAGAASGAAAAAGGDKGGSAVAEAARVAALTPEQKSAEAAAAKIASDAKAVADKGPAIDYTGLKLPEGYKSAAEDPVFGKALTIFDKLKIAPEGAQELMDFTVERDKAMAQAVNDSNAAGWAKQADGWKAETAKTFSAEDLGIAKTAFEKVFDPATLKYLEGLRYTDHPGFVAGMVKIGKAIKDDTFVAGNAAANGAASDARKQFPNSNMNP